MEFIIYPVLSCPFLICACSKDKKHCYECDLQSTGQYTDTGCYTEDEWDKLILTDFSGNNINKNQFCRKK